MKLLIEGDYLLNKFPGKGGWTYVEIPEIAPNKNNPFGWVKISGSIDSYSLSHYKLMPLGKGKLFLPVKASIRKAIQKQEGDTVHLILFEDAMPEAFIYEIHQCIADENPILLDQFLQLKNDQQMNLLNQIYDVKNEQEKVVKIAALIDWLYQKK